MDKTEMIKTLEKQLQLLSERSQVCGTSDLIGLTNAMCNVTEQIMRQQQASLM